MVVYIRAHFASYWKWYGLVLLAAAVVVWALFFRPVPQTNDTLIVHARDFVQKINVSGTVVAANNVDLSFSLGGRVTHVYARVGDTVAEGKILAEVENGDLRAQLLQRQASLETQQAKLASLKQGTRPEQLAVTQSSVSSARVALDQANEALLNAIQDSYTTADNVVHNTIDSFVNNARVNPQLVFPVTNAQLKVTFELDRMGIERTLADWKNLIATADAPHALEIAAEVQKNLTQTSTVIADANAALNHAIVGVTSSQTSLDAWTADIGTARTTIDTRTTALTSAMTAVRAARSTLETAEKTYTLQNAGTLQSDIDAQIAQVKAAEADVQNAQSQLAKSMIRAPFGGVVTNMDAKVGQVAVAGTPLVSLMSKGVSQIESYVPEVNVAALAVGNTASTTLDAYGPNEYFGAKVIAIEPAETVRDGVSTYKTTLQFDGSDVRIRPGMTADITIVSGVRPNAIIIPQGAIFDRSGEKYVLVKEGELFVERSVEVGPTVSLGQVEIRGGLSEGDVIALSSKQKK